MRVIIAGSRDVTDLKHVILAVHNSKFEVTEIVSGAARGVDTLGEMWAEENNIPVTLFPADWDKYGKSAGYKRNEEMAKHADGLIAIRKNMSKGTTHMIDIATKAGLSVYVVDLD